MSENICGPDTPFAKTKDETSNILSSGHDVPSSNDLPDEIERDPSHVLFATIEDGTANNLSSCDDHDDMASSDDPADDSGRDPDYKPENLAHESSDEAVSQIIKKNHEKNRKHVYKKRKRSNKSKESNKTGIAVEKKSNNDSPLTSSDDDITLAELKHQSILRVKAEKKLKKQHKIKLDKLLESNGLVRKSIPEDGDCFFNATLEQVRDIPHLSRLYTSAEELRQSVCNHMSKERNHYISYLELTSLDDEQSVPCEIEQAINFLRIPGHWATELADLIPLAICNVLNAKVRIYSSISGYPIIDVEPDMGNTNDNDRVQLLYAYIAIPNYEHFDSCYKMTGSYIQSSNFLNNHDNAEPPGTSSQLSSALNEVELPAPGEVKDTQNKPNDTFDEQEAQLAMSHAAVQPEDFNNTTTVTVADGPMEVDATSENVEACLTSSQEEQHISKGRKRKSNPEMWKKNLRKNLRLLGKDYIGSDGKKRPKRSIDLKPCLCRFKCSDYHSDECRMEIFHQFWELGHYERQGDFIRDHIRERPPKMRSASSEKQRSSTREFVLNLDTNQRVCKDFFMKTLDIGPKMIEIALKKKSGGTAAMGDKRGRHVPANKTKDDMLHRIRKHIESFPKMNSHYARKDTSREFLSADLNVRKMYNLFSSKCQTDGVDTCTEKTYRKVFNEEYNISFHRPKKDLCSTCETYKIKQKENLNDSETDEKYKEHIIRKEQARNEKSNDSKQAKEDNSYFVGTFDLQSVLFTPCSMVSTLYYMRKLSVYNLTIYSHGDKRGTCYMWNEGQGRRGSCEIATCLLIYLQSLPRTTKEVTFFSDSCTGQNRNRYVAAALLYAVQHIPYIQVINQKFLESGHTDMEVDSMHAAIEFAKRNTPIYVPSEWHTVVRMARRKQPYSVVPLEYDDFFNFKQIAKENITFPKKDVTGMKIEWLKLKWFQFRKEEPDKIYIKYAFSDESFNELRVRPIPTRRGKQSATNVSDQVFDIPKLYSKPLPISTAKKQDLIVLCKKSLIPTCYHAFYENLHTEETQLDILPEPDQIEDPQDSE